MSREVSDMLHYIDHLLEGPQQMKDKFYQGHEDYMHEYCVRAEVQRVVEYVRGWPDDRNVKHKGIWDGSCYYCLPGGKGTNDDDVISYEQCPCWCHENITLVEAKRRLIEKTAYQEVKA